MAKQTSSQAIAFIGGGNMARALIGGLIHAGQAADRLTVADPAAEQRQRLQDDFGIAGAGSNAAACSDKQAVVLAVKPQVMDSVLAEIASALDDDTVVISVAAGVSLDQLAASLGRRRALVRAMPNTPALYGAGITGLAASGHLSDAQRLLVEQIFTSAGEVTWISDESWMDAVTAVSGSGPAYFFALTEHLAKAGAAAGLPAELAALLARQTAIGAGVMLARSDVDAGELRRRVTSPGGTTAAALARFDEDGLALLVERAVDAAVQRGRKLGAS
ncbi:MAG: pyrroline-5-carboxylate reductase [Wenzhouxiangella sp.]|nr:pyrroline-5-carboxylate reductase [Wenzhouxiangella sp.]TVR96528.1 MAG: pyrroline-5-carboxylate reductase [Wenzhouxiangellaceae bacterium]